MFCARTKWYIIPSLAVVVVSVTAALQNYTSSARLRRCTNARIVEDAKSIIAAVEIMATTVDGGPRVLVYLNTLQKSVALPRRLLGSAARELPSVFDCYAIACLSERVSDALKADLWNCLGAILEESLRNYLDADPLSVDSSAAVASLAMSALLQQRYHVTHFLSSNKREPLQFRSLNTSTFAAAVRKNQSDGSTLRSLVVFARLLRSSCSLSQQLLLGTFVLASVTQISRLLVFASPLVTPSRVMYVVSVLSVVSESADGACISWKYALCRLLVSMPGRLLAEGTVGTLFSHLFAAAQDAASDALLRRLRSNIKSDTLLALARFDFVADTAWRVPHRIYSALSDATNFSISDVDHLVSMLTEYARRCRTVCTAPLSCVAGWVTRQGIHFLQRQWTRSCLMHSFVDAYAAAVPLAERGTHQPRGPNDCSPVRMATSPQPLLSHHGLQLLLLASVGDASARRTTAVQVTLAMRTRWPVFPIASLRATQRALEALAQSGNAALQAKCAAVQALLCDFGGVPDTPSLVPTSTSHGPSFPPSFPPFATVLGLMRSQGEECHTPHQPSLPLASDVAREQCGLWAAPSTCEEVVNKIIFGLEGLPLMAALATREGHQAVYTPSSTLRDEGKYEDALETAFEVTRAVEGGDIFSLPPLRPFSSASAFQFDIGVTQLHYHEYEAYAQSIAAILYVQQGHQPLLDHGVPSTLRAAPSWRVTFDRVSFRYPGSTVDVLHDVSFDVASGGFLGIVGYSGAGKSTLLLLLSRVYAPTEGQIYINGCPIDRLPPRALRRRLGVTWQGDDHTRFLNGLSVERNVAYGALHRASSETIAQALTAAYVSDVVAARPHGVKGALQSNEWSGGEQERLNVARALMVAPDEAGAYLFDECTSGLDSVTEAHVFARERRARRTHGDGQRVTQIMVSHRLSSLQDADEILVLAHGRVVERGTWTELLAHQKKTLFRELYDAQALD
ncbi:ABC transporter family-like protein [Leptomonas seymouri]|uniref:ABC transporter family-like protein n=1 Tax=Leptomonas seymouri TaxID=5684 RepID=A0A0N1I508_LEPSE|nr:ABC transporter family-like protein [Leptomonas seymouri]|eukprot:KPI86588.1 ABC transporter family-like protein [Leptomonas seymouri]